MDVFSLPFLQALIAIIVIDLVLAGDNAIVIGLAARNLAPDLQKKAVFWGAIGAVAVRATLTLVVVWLLMIPGLLTLGGLALVWIGCRLVADEGGEDGHHVVAVATFRQAIQTIVVADTIMGIDNVLAIAGAAHGSFLLVIIGLIVSIPIVMFGSTLILKWVERFPVIITIGAGVLGWTAAKMISSEPALAAFFKTHHGWKLTLFALCIGIVIATPLLRKFRNAVSAKWAAIIFTLAWLTVWDYIEEYVDAVYFPQGGAPVAVDLIDLCMWLGWVPIAIMIHEALSGASQTPTTRPDPTAQDQSPTA